MGFCQEEVLKLRKTVKKQVRGVEKMVELRLDLNDLLILQQIADFPNRHKVAQVLIEGKAFFWVSYKQIIQELPILDIGKQALSDRLSKMVELGVLERVIQTLDGTANMTLFRVGENYEILRYSNGGCRSQLQDGIVSDYDMSRSQTPDVNKQVIKYPVDNINNPSDEELLSEEIRQNSPDSQKKVKSKKELCKEAMAYFNAKADSTPGCNLPRVTKVTDGRERAVFQRVKEYGADIVAKVIDMAACNSFLNGSGSKSFVASFDWIMRPSNFIKIYEGNYEHNNIINTNGNGKGEQKTNYFSGRYNGDEATRQRAVAYARGLHELIEESARDEQDVEGYY